jgi:hypothetical protein
MMRSIFRLLVGDADVVGVNQEVQKYKDADEMSGGLVKSYHNSRAES